MTNPWIEEDWVMQVDYLDSEDIDDDENDEIYGQPSSLSNMQDSIQEEE